MTEAPDEYDDAQQDDSQDDSQEEIVNIFTHRAAVDWLFDHGYILSVGTLMNMASQGIGPPFEKWGSRVVYTEHELKEWAESRWR